MKRREAIGLTLCGATGIPACRKTESGGTAVPDVSKTQAREGEDFVPVRVEESLEIRTIAGLRPYRPSGFVVRREDTCGKILVHNYGHGGGGVSLSWGSAHLAVNLAQPVRGQDCAVVGAGVMAEHRATASIAGRAREDLRQRPPVGNDVQCGRRSVAAVLRIRPPPPHRSLCGAIGCAVAAQLLSQRAGGWIGGPGGVLRDLHVGFRDFAPGEHVFSAGYARRFYSMLIEPAVYLRRLMDAFRDGGGEIEVRPFASAAEVMALPQPVIFNCSGLGSGALFGDRETRRRLLTPQDSALRSG